MAVRMPALLAGICATVLVFVWVRGLHSTASGWTAVILLISNPLWNIFSRLCYTDMVYTAATVGALFAIARDGGLERRWTRVLFIGCCAGGILAKNIAGLLPVAVWALVLALRGRQARPAFSRVTGVAAGIAAVALPWHLYQLAVHPHWFWADYVQIQLLGFGTAPPAQSSAEGNLLFYARRLALTDPALAAFALASLPALWRGLRERSAAAQLVVAWIAVMACALMAFRYRNLPYALNLIPPLAVLAAIYGPGGAWRIPVLSALFVAKSLLPDTVFGLPMRTADPIPSFAAIREYEQMARPNDLIYVSPDDEFYSSTLNLPRVRYAFLDPQGTVVRYAPHFVYLGITMTVDQFLRGEESSRGFAKRLEEWGLTGADPLGTAIVAASEEELIRLASSCPHADFYLPAALAGRVREHIQQTHIIRGGAPGRMFLLAREPSVASVNPAVRVLSR